MIAIKTAATFWYRT